MEMVIRVLGPHDLEVLELVAPDVFDHPINREWAAEFLADPRHHLVCAIVDGKVVGFASGVHYLHPDKPTELWVNEVGVGTEYQNRGIGRRLLHELLEHGRKLGCVAAWVGTEVDNVAARRTYAAVGGVESPEPFVLVSFDLQAPATGRDWAPPVRKPNP